MLNQQQIISRSIDCLRLPLAVFVVMQHVSPDIASWASAALLDNATQVLSLEILMRLFTITLAGIAVPIFYVISGYLLYNKCGGNYNFDNYKGQVKKRIGSLVIPYLLWNLIVFIFLYVLVPFIKIYIGNADPSLMLDSLHKFRAIFNIQGVPLDGPLYFIRNLFLLVLVSPAIHFLIKRTGAAFVILVVALWLIVDISTENPIYSYVKSLPFFTVGAYVGIKKPCLEWLFNNSKWIIYSFVLCIIVDSLSAVGIVDNSIIQNYNNVGYYNEINRFSFRLSNYLGVLAAFCLAGIISVRKRKYESLNSSVFFIYSFHIVVLAMCMGGGILCVSNRQCNYVYSGISNNPNNMYHCTNNNVLFMQKVCSANIFNPFWK